MRYAARPETAGAAASPRPTLSKVNVICIETQRMFLVLDLSPLVLHKKLYQELPQSIQLPSLGCRVNTLLMLPLHRQPLRGIDFQAMLDMFQAQNQDG